MIMYSCTILSLFCVLVAAAFADNFVPFNGHCTNRPGKCAPGLVCVGTPELKKCRSLKKVNQRCNIDPFWVCDDGLVCEERKCRIDQGYECTEYPNSCADGLECVGTKDYKQCEKLIKLGGECLIEPYWVCEDGLTCDNNICLISQGEECTKTPNLCAKGLHCVGTDDYKQCEKPVPVGGSCLIEPYWVCEDGLTCEHGVCRIPRDGDCTGKEDYCLKGLLSCVGPMDNKQCKFPLKLGEPCTGPYDFCGKGLICGGLGKARRCIDGAKEGSVCRDTNPKLTCEGGLRCVDGFCRV